jgi:hypothetical protein
LRILENVQISLIQNHLKVKGSAVSLDLNAMPGRPDEYRGFRAQLDAGDVDNLILWWEFENHTIAGNCKVTDALPSAASLEKVTSFIEGNPAKGFGPIDLRTAQNMELVIVANDLQSTIAQHLSQKNFQDVSAFVCVHPELLKWAYIPMYYKKLWKLQ